MASSQIYRSFLKNRSRNVEEDQFRLQRRLTSATILDEESSHVLNNNSDINYPNQNEDNNANDETHFNEFDSISTEEDNSSYGEADDDFRYDRRDVLSDDEFLDYMQSKNERVLYNLRKRLYNQPDDINDILEWVSLKECLNVS